MSRLAYIWILAGLLGACAAQQNTLTDRRLACAAVGLDPGNAAFDQCVVDLDQTLRANNYPLD